MTCPHDFTERETAVTADGYCPLCLAADNERLRGIIQFNSEASRHEREGLRADNERLRALVRDLADDLASELRGRYWSPDGTVHPAEQRRYERDMANVYEARRALEPKP